MTLKVESEPGRPVEPDTSPDSAAETPPTPVALVTGAGSIIGRAVVARLLANGYAVVGVEVQGTRSLS